MTGPTRTVVVGSRHFDVVDDRSLGTEALVRCRVTDGMTGATPRGLIARPLTPLTAAHLTDGGYLVVTGRADLALADVLTTAYDIEVELSATGITPQTVSLHVAAGATPLPRVLPDFVIAESTVAVAGIARRSAFPFTPVSAATVSAAAPVTLLRTALAADHDAGTPVRERALGAPTGTSALAAPVTSGDVRLPVIGTGGFAVGQVVAVDPVETRELAFIDAVDTVSATLVVRTPLRRSRPAGTAVSAHTLGAIGGATALAGAARAGDGVIRLMAPLTGDVIDTFEADASRREVRDVHVLTGGDGRYRIDGVRGISGLVLDVTSGLLTSGPISVPLDGQRDPITVDADLA